MFVVGRSDFLTLLSKDAAQASGGSLTLVTTLTEAKRLGICLLTKFQLGISRQYIVEMHQVSDEIEFLFSSLVLRI